MRSLSNRLGSLESRTGTDLPPAVKAWLGWSVSAHELESDVTARPLDPTTLSMECREWLGI